MGRFSKAFEHGLVIQRLIERLRRVGLVINPYYLFREGVVAVAPPHPGPEFTSSVLTGADLEEVAACTAWATPERLQQRLDKGHLCILLKAGDQVAGYTWADPHEVNDSACDYELEPGAAYLYDAFIVPDYRGRSLAPFMRARCYEHLREAGKQSFYSISDCFNTPAIRFKEKLEARIIRLYLQIRMSDRQLGQWILKDYDQPRRGAG